MTVIRTVLRLALLPAALLALAGPARAQFTATKYVEAGVSYPGVGTISQFGGPPSLVNGRVAFTAFRPTAGPGIFTATPGTPTAVATTSTPVPPGGFGNFIDFFPQPVGLSASGVAFRGVGMAGPPSDGNYTNVTGSLAPVVTMGSPFPTGGVFTNFSLPAVSGQTVAFAGSNGPPGTAQGIFTKTGAGPLVTLASLSTPIPGGTGNFTNFATPAGPAVPTISGTNVVFVGQGSGGQVGVFASLVTAMVPVATNATAAPGGTGNFSDFGVAPVISGTTVAFHGTSPGRTGVYVAVAGVGLARVADTTTPIPGGSGFFSSFTPVTLSISGNRVTFRGVGSTGQAGIYTGVPGLLQKVVATGDIIDGRTVNFVDASLFASSGSDTAVFLGFTSGPPGVYVFSPVPEPAGLLAVGLAGLAAARAWRRRRAPVA
jgi:hypothetical protein